MIDKLGSIVHSREMRAFGAYQQTGVVDDWAFAGQTFSGTTGIVYNLMRSYSPEIGRYRSRDPIGHFAGPNTYLYTRNNPIGSIDPSGLYPVPEDLSPNCWVIIVDDESETGTRSFTNDPWVVDKDIILGGIPIKSRIGKRKYRLFYIARIYWEQVTYNFLIDIVDIEYLVACLEEGECGFYVINYDPGWHFDDRSRRLEDTVKKWTETIFRDIDLPYKPKL